MNQANKEAGRPRIVIGMDGGLIQWILSDIDLDVLVLDYDVEDLDSDCITKIQSKECVATEGHAETDLQEVEEIFAEFEKGGPP